MQTPSKWLRLSHSAHRPRESKLISPRHIQKILYSFLGRNSCCQSDDFVIISNSSKCHVNNFAIYSSDGNDLIKFNAVFSNCRLNC